MRLASSIIFYNTINQTTSTPKKVLGLSNAGAPATNIGKGPKLTEKEITSSRENIGSETGAGGTGGGEGPKETGGETGAKEVQCPKGQGPDPDSGECVDLP